MTDRRRTDRNEGRDMIDIVADQIGDHPTRVADRQEFVTRFNAGLERAFARNADRDSARDTRRGRSVGQDWDDFS